MATIDKTKDIPLGNMLHSTALDGMLVHADEVMDENWGESQNIINTELKQLVTDKFDLVSELIEKRIKTLDYVDDSDEEDTHYVSKVDEIDGIIRVDRLPIPVVDVKIDADDKFLEATNGSNHVVMLKTKDIASQSDLSSLKVKDVQEKSDGYVTLSLSDDGVVSIGDETLSTKIDSIDEEISKIGKLESYEKTKYSSPLEEKVEDKNAHVAEGDTIKKGFKKVETTISILTDEVLDNEKVVAGTINNLRSAIGLDGQEEITYVPETSANYINNASSLHNATLILDAEIKRVEDKSGTVGEYTTTVYSDPFEDKVTSADAHITTGDAVDTALKKQETSLSLLVDEMLDNETVVSQSINTLANAVGTYDAEGVIKYMQDKTSNYIGGAVSVHNATILLDTQLGKMKIIKLNSTDDNVLTNDDNGLYLSNVWDAGEY